MELNALVELLAEDLPANETYSRTIDALGHLLSELSPADWGAPTIEGWTVKGLVAHLVAVEEYFGRQLGLWAPRDRWATGRPAVPPDAARLRRMSRIAVPSLEPSKVTASSRSGSSSAPVCSPPEASP